MDKVWSCTNHEEKAGDGGLIDKLQVEINHIKNKNAEIVQISADFEKVIHIMDSPLGDDKKNEPPASIPQKSVKHSAIGLKEKSSKSPTPQPS